MLAPLRCSNSFFLFSLSASLLLASFCFAAPVPQQDARSSVSITELKSHADAGDPSARHQLAAFLISADPASPGYDLALSWLQSLASQQVPDAEFLIGYLYEHGKGFPRDYTKAFENYRVSALHGYAPAENNIGSLYERGLGVHKDLPLALQWYRAAALHGNPAGQLNLGNFYYFGYAVHVDFGEALKWYRTAADQGLAKAQDYLAYCYLKGVGVPVDNAQAAHWARLAADQGHPRAQALLGYLYETGRGLPLDYVSAYTWYSRAVAAGDDSSAEHLKALSQVMTRRQLDEANSLVSAQSISRQPDSAPSSPAGLSLLPNP
jgi:TPR repeat protein